MAPPAVLTILLAWRRRSSRGPPRREKPAFGLAALGAAPGAGAACLGAGVAADELPAEQLLWGAATGDISLAMV